MGQILYQGMAGRITVREEGRCRRLYIGEMMQGGICLDDPTACTFPVTEGFHQITALREQPPERILIIGLGAGELPRSFLRRFPKSRIRVVEIDPVVVQVARRHFFLPHHRRLEVVVADGYADLARSPERYDLIVLDACGPEGLPQPFRGDPFLRLAAARLTPNGMLAANLFDLSEAGDGAERFARAAARFFPERHLLPVGDRGSFAYLNQLLFCGLRPDRGDQGRAAPPAEGYAGVLRVVRS
ncbi:MAG: spermidine synthase [Bacillota bacterium]